MGAIRWLPYLQLCGHSELKEACVEVIAIEMEFVLKCTDFLLLTIDFLVQLLSRNDLVVSTEYNLYVVSHHYINCLGNCPRLVGNFDL